MTYDSIDQIMDELEEIYPYFSDLNYKLQSNNTPASMRLNNLQVSELIKAKNIEAELRGLYSDFDNPPGEAINSAYSAAENMLTISNMYERGMKADESPDIFEKLKEQSEIANEHIIYSLNSAGHPVEEIEEIMDDYDRINGYTGYYEEVALATENGDMTNDNYPNGIDDQHAGEIEEIADKYSSGEYKNKARRAIYNMTVSMLTISECAEKLLEMDENGQVLDTWEHTNKSFKALKKMGKSSEYLKETMQTIIDGQEQYASELSSSDLRLKEHVAKLKEERRIAVGFQKAPETSGSPQITQKRSELSQTNNLRLGMHMS